MTASNFANVLPITLAYEGGKTTHRADPGNWTGGKVGKGVLKGTNMGISAASYPNLDIMNLTKAQVSAIYERDYWRPSLAADQPNGLDLMVFDAAVNSGNGRGRGWLTAAKSKSKTTVGQIQAYASVRLSFLRALSTFRTFGKGWTTRVASVEAKAIRMAAGPVAAPKVLLAAAASQEAKKATKVKTATGAGAAGSAASGAVAPAADTISAGHGTAVIVVVVALTVIAVAIGGFLAWQHSVRAKTLAAEAAK